jgi:flagellar basal body-associated protein FliL
MADDNKPQDGAEEAAPKAKPQGLMPLLLTSVILAVVLGGAGFALAYFVVPARLAASNAAAASAGGPAAPATAIPATAATAPASADSAGKATHSPSETASDGGSSVTKFTIDDITVNIADTRGNRFVRAGVYFEAEGPVLDELEANRPRMIDTVGQVLSTKTLDELTAPNIRGVLREELLGIINPTLKSGRVDNLYFTDLLVQ